MFNGQTATSNQGTSFLSKVYGFMSLSLLLSFATAYIMAKSGALTQLVNNSGAGVAIIGACIVEIVLVFAIHYLAKHQARIALGAVVVFSIIDGATMSVIFIAYPIKLIMMALGVAIATFGGMSAIGLTTHKELTWGTQLMGALIALIVVEIVELFFFNNIVDMFISGIGVIVFCGFSIYDSQKIKEIGEKTGGSLGLLALATLELYLDFINLFLYLLRLFADLQKNN